MLKETRMISNLDDEDLINLERECAYDVQIDDNDEQIDMAPKEFTLI
jgi:hypothetical protein